MSATWPATLGCYEDDVSGAMMGLGPSASARRALTGTSASCLSSNTSLRFNDTGATSCGDSLPLPYHDLDWSGGDVVVQDYGLCGGSWNQMLPLSGKGAYSAQKGINVSVANDSCYFSVYEVSVGCCCAGGGGRQSMPTSTCY